MLKELSAIPAIRAILKGKPDRDTYVRYLINAFKYAEFSSPVMGTGALRCMEDPPKLATYLLHHADEEMGHHYWALQDLKDLGVNEEQARAASPVPACSTLVGYIHYVAGFENPLGPFGWLYVLEATGNGIESVAGRQPGGWTRLGRQGRTHVPRDRLGSPLADVRLVRTEEERARVYPFRYSVCVDELGIETPEAYPEQRWLRDSLDDCSCNYALFDAKDVRGAIRVTDLEGCAGRPAQIVM